MLFFNSAAGVAMWAYACLAAAIPVAAQQLNSTLQTAADRAMAGKSGTAVVLNVATAEVVAAYRLDIAARRLAHPGSSIKPFTLLALLQAGKIDGQTVLACKRSLTITGRRLDCTHPTTTTPLDAAAALAYSCNSYFTAVATRLTPVELRDSLIKDEFTAPTGLAVQEVNGNVALASTSEQLQLQAIGEWGVSVTPLELLRGYLNLALLKKENSDPKLRPLFDGLESSTSYGMGRLAQPERGVRVAGKTGTSVSQEGKWTHAWFAGFASAENPQIVLVVFLEKGRGGSDAAVVARQIFASFSPATKKSVTVSGAAR